MSGTVDDEVVRMRFDNNAFERGVAATLGTLSKLKASLSFNGATKGLDQVEAKASHLDLSGANKSIDESSRHWSLWHTAGLIAFASLVHRAVNAGINIAKAFTINPISEGFKSYETQIDAAKTIMSNTGAKLPLIEKQLADLQTYANQTVYSFSDMAQNIGTFTAAGVKLVPATMAIKGMGNTAALSGANVQQLNSAMYQMSQAMSSGVIRLQDWNSLSNANMGGQNIQKVLMATASTIKDTGPKMDAALKKYGNFRNSLTAGWLTADVFSKSMGIMAGTVDKATGKTVAFSVAQLKAKGYTQAQAVELNRLSQAAIESATQIRTYAQLTAALKEEVGTAYGTIFKTLFGDLNGATALFTTLHNVAENALTRPIYALNNLLQQASKFGARTAAIKAFGNIFKSLAAILNVVKSAFREIFPPETGRELAATVKHFEAFTERLKMSKATAAELKRVFAGVFAIFDIGKQAVSGLWHMFTSLFGSLAHGSGQFLNVAARVGDWIVNFDKLIKQGQIFDLAFAFIGNMVKSLGQIFGIAAKAIGALFSRFKPKSSAGLENSVYSTYSVLNKLVEFSKNLTTFLGGLSAKVAPAVAAVVNAMKRVGQMIAQGFNSQTFSNILKTLQTGLLAGIVVLLKKFLSNGMHVDIGGGFLGQMKEVLEGVTGNLKAMQQQLKAKALLEIAIAMGILALALAGLAMIDPKKLQGALQAMAIGFGELLAAMGILTKISGSAGFVKIPVMAASLDLLATAILVLATAVIALSKLSWAELEKGLSAVGLLLAGLSAASIPLSANSSGMVRAGVGIAAIAVAMNLLYIAVRAFATMSWSQMLKGLAGVGMALAGIAIAMRLMPRDMVLQSASLILIATAVNALYLAVKNFSSLDWKTMLRGIAGVALALTGIAVAMHLMPSGMLIQSVALIAVAAALQLIARAVESMSKMSWMDIARGMTALAGSMTILALGMTFMSGAVPGALAMLIVANALRIFVPVLMALANMSWAAIASGLGAVAATFAVIGVAGLLLTPVIPSLLGLGVALTLVGVAMLAFGAGAALLGVGMTAIAAAGGTAIGILLSGLQSLIAILPLAAKNLALALVGFITVIGQNAPIIVGAFVSILNQLLLAVPKILPPLVIAINSLIVAILSVLVTNIPKIIAAGLQLLMSLLLGISSNIGQVTTAVVNIIVNFLNALAANLPRIIAAGVNLLFKFLEGVAAAAGKIPGEVVKLIFIFVSSMLSNLGPVWNAGTALLGKLVGGILSAQDRVASAATSLMSRFINACISWFSNLNRLGGQIISNVVNAISGAIGRVNSIALSIGSAIFNGIMSGIGDLAGAIGDKIAGAAGGALNTARRILHIGGPSQLFADEVGYPIASGIAKGIDDNAGMVSDSVNNLNKSSVLAMKKTMGALADTISANTDYNPTITPILDLSQVRKDAGQINGLVGVNPITPAVSYDQASSISAAAHAARLAAAAEAQANSNGATSGTTIKLEQNNYSPKALSTVDIYRQTNNQLSRAKRLLGVDT